MAQEPTGNSEGSLDRFERDLHGEPTTALELPGADTEHPSTSHVKGWRRLFRGNRVVWIVAGVAILSLVGGLLLGRFVVSPSDAAADAAAPEPGLITVPVEFAQLSNDVTIRGDVGFADAVEVKIDTADVGGPAVVTGQVPAVGTVLNPLSVALEVAGRPVIVLPGDLPSYRTLRLGVSGPDVAQLKAALSAVGIDPGSGGNVFDAATSNAVAALYAAVGYPAPASPEGTAEAVRGAQDMVRSAEQSIQAARNALNAAGGGPDPVELKSADNAIVAAQGNVTLAEIAVKDATAALTNAQKALKDAEEQVPPDAEKISAAKIALAAAQSAVPSAQIALVDRQNDLALAKLQREQLFAGRDTSPEQASLDSAYAQYESAVAALDTAREGAMTFLPASEVLYLTQLPRRVDAVNVERGTILQGVAMTVSGAKVELSATAAEADAKLLKVGDKASFALPDGTPHNAVVAAITQGTGSGSGSGSGSGGGGSGAGRWTITFTPDPLTDEQITALQGQNVRVSIPVSSTEGEVLSVPLAALTAGPGGESRVEIVTGDPKQGEDAATVLVTVETGLAAGGYVEVTPVDGELSEGDLVVVGR